MDSIPDHAVEVVTENWENGLKKRALYYVDGQEIGARYYESTGTLSRERGLQNCVRHGHYRIWHKNGKLCEEGYYHQGKEHGETKQYDHDGQQIGSYTMVHGTGMDLWYCAPGVLSEEREMLDGNRHGYERWWRSDNQTVYEESHFQNGIEHGIFRQWNLQGKLKRGYPQYFVMGKRVAKRQYERAWLKDSTLPPFVANENQPTRQLPAAVLKIRAAMAEKDLQMRDTHE